MTKRFQILLFFLLFSLTFISAGELKVTQEHPFLINGNWIDAKDLKAGDNLTTVDGKRIVIDSIELITPENPFLVYNLEAGIYHNFVVGKEKVVVHNSDQAGWSGSQLHRSVSGYKKGTVQYDEELIPAWAYFDNPNELVLDPLNLGQMIKKIDAIKRDGYWGSARTPLAAKLDQLAGEGIIRQAWFTTIPAENLPPKLLGQFLHGGGPSGLPSDLGVVEFMVPRKTALEAYTRKSLPDLMNYHKITSWQYESSYIRAVNQEYVLPAGTFKARPFFASELGTNTRIVPLVGLRAAAMTVMQIGVIVGGGYATKKLQEITYVGTYQTALYIYSKDREAAELPETEAVSYYDYSGMNPGP